MPRWFHALLYLLMEQYAARRDAQIRFLRAEVQILRNKLPGNRVILDPKDRGHLLSLGEQLGHRVKDIIGIVSLQTYQRWVRERGRGKEAGTVGRSRIGKDLRELILRMARGNAQWGYRRIVGELGKLHLPVSKSTVSRVLKDEQIYPEPNKGRGRTGDATWQRFIQLHMNTLVACDFFTKAVVTPLGIRTAYFLFFIHLGSRRVYLTSATYHTDGPWVLQQARHFRRWCERQGIECSHLIHDRDRKFPVMFDTLLQGHGVRVIKTPFRAPNANAFAESWVATVKRECLDHFVCFSLGHLDHIAQRYVAFYNEDRPHQGVGNRPLSTGPTLATGPAGPSAVRCRPYLGGLLKTYYRLAA